MGTDRRSSIVIFSGPTATILNSAPLITSDQGRRADDVPRLTVDGFDVLRPQRLAASVTVYIEAFSAHPLESQYDADYLPPDGYVGREGMFHVLRSSPHDRPVYRATLSPEDGLYLLPYLGRTRSDMPWGPVPSSPEGARSEPVRQTFFPDSRRLVEEIDRFCIDDSGNNNILSRMARFSHVRAAPSGGYTASRGSEKVEEPGVDFFPYSPPELSYKPSAAVLAEITNVVQTTLDTGDFRGCVWLEGSPTIEETIYWLSLVVDTKVAICGTSSQHPHGVIGNDGDADLIDCVRYLVSGLWRDRAGRDRIGAVVVKDRLIYAAREVRKVAARSGGYGVSGGHGGIVGSSGSVNQRDRPVITFLPTRRHTFKSNVNVSRLPSEVLGVELCDGTVANVRVPVKDERGRLLASAIPRVVIFKYARYDSVGAEDGLGDVHVRTVINDCLEGFPLAGFVLEGNVPFGEGYEAVEQALQFGVFCGMPFVCASRDAAGDFVARRHRMSISGSNLSSVKARMLLMACLLRFGSAPLSVSPDAPSAKDRKRSIRYLNLIQRVFDTH